MYDQAFIDSFWERVDKTGDCWVWVKGKSRFGHGSVKQPNAPAMSTHRVAWQIVNGPIPKGKWVLHKCDNAPCVRPDHLYVGTRADNNRDMIERNRVARGERASHTKLTEDRVMEIRRLYFEARYQQKEIAEMFEVNKCQISRIITGFSWSHLPTPYTKRQAHKKPARKAA